MSSALRPNPTLASARSTFAGQHLAFKSVSVSSRTIVRPAALNVEAKRVCELTGVKRNKANSVSFSNKHNRKWQEPNLQYKKIFWEHGQRWVKLKVCTRAMKTIEKNGLDILAKEAGIDLWKLPYEDARPQRLAYLAENKMKVPVAKNAYAMKNQAKIAASKKVPKYPVYEQGGRIVWIRPGMEELIFGKADEAQQQQQADPADQELKVTLSEDY